MIKKLFMAALLMATVWGGTLSASANSLGGKVKTTFTDNQGNHDQGIFNVLVTQDVSNALLWHVAVSWNSSLTNPNPFVDVVQVRLLDSTNPPVPPVGQQVASVANGKVSGPGGTVNWNEGIPSPPFGNGDESDFFSPTNNPPDVIDKSGQSFTGDILLKPGSAKILGVYFNLIGSGSGNGIFPGAVTPEGASLALLLPGLLPLAIGLRRRRTNTPKGE